MTNDEMAAERQVETWTARHVAMGTDASRYAYATLAYRAADESEAYEDAAKRAAVHAAAPDGSAECDQPGPATESMENVTCPACRKLIAPWIEGTAQVAAPAAPPAGDDLAQARLLFPSVFAMIEG
jgi:hypothetical protein